MALRVSYVPYVFWCMAWGATRNDSEIVRTIALAGPAGTAVDRRAIVPNKTPSFRKTGNKKERVCVWRSGLIATCRNSAAKKVQKVAGLPNESVTFFRHSGNLKKIPHKLATPTAVPKDEGTAWASPLEALRQSSNRKKTCAKKGRHLRSIAAVVDGQS